MIALLSALLGFDDIYNEIQNFKLNSLKHCNFQLWYPDETSEEMFYINATEHGATLSDLNIENTKEEFLENSRFSELSAVKFGVWPIIFLACRHYRVPIPIQFLESFRKSGSQPIEENVRQ